MNEAKYRQKRNFSEEAKKMKKRGTGHAKKPE